MVRTQAGAVGQHLGVGVALTGVDVVDLGQVVPGGPDVPLLEVLALRWLGWRYRF